MTTPAAALRTVRDSWEQLRDCASCAELPDPNAEHFGSRMSVLFDARHDTRKARAARALNAAPEALRAYPVAAVQDLTRALADLVSVL